VEVAGLSVPAGLLLAAGLSPPQETSAITMMIARIIAMILFMGVPPK
jgi:hypothetical protein